jgi:hypothetical protein
LGDGPVRCILEGEHPVRTVAFRGSGAGSDARGTTAYLVRDGRRGGQMTAAQLTSRLIGIEIGRFECRVTPCDLVSDARPPVAKAHGSATTGWRSVKCGP